MAQHRYALRCDQHPLCAMAHRIQSACSHLELELPHVEAAQRDHKNGRCYQPEDAIARASAAAECGYAGISLNAAGIVLAELRLVSCEQDVEHSGVKHCCPVGPYCQRRLK